MAYLLIVLIIFFVLLLMKHVIDTKEFKKSRDEFTATRTKLLQDAVEKDHKFKMTFSEKERLRLEGIAFKNISQGYVQRIQDLEFRIHIMERDRRNDRTSYYSNMFDNEPGGANGKDFTLKELNQIRNAMHPDKNGGRFTELTVKLNDLIGARK